MTTILVDANVLLDFFSEDSDWHDWSAAMLTDAAQSGQVAIDPLIYAEVWSASIRLTKSRTCCRAITSSVPA